MHSPPKSAKQIFLDAIEAHVPAQWPTFLDQACGDDAQLRRRVAVLLEAHVADGSLLDKPAIGTTAILDQPVLESSGARIGPYTLRELLGEGGMGSVYVAEQEQPIRRKVALKIIKPGMDTRQVLSRFETERQVLALMDHPNIAKVLDAGTTESGLPYFVMELVRGVPITEFCDQRRLDPRQRLELFVQVCRAIQHAHQKGIIHRDIKPSNILVTLHDDLAVPKVIDFGISKATSQGSTDQTAYTAFNQMLGTPLYMSPEQAEMNALDVDTRSDVYSLGVLLYELLTGNTPFDRDTLRQAGFDEMRRLIREVDPPCPSQRVSTLNAQADSTTSNCRGVDERRLERILQGELDWIVMKALEKDRTRRYESASSFASDVERYLHDEAVQACPPSTMYRLQKLARRNRVALVTGALLTATLLLGTAISTWQAIRATLAEREADEQRSKAEANLKKTKAAVDEYFTLISENKLLDAPGLQPLRKELLQSALRYYQDFVAAQEDDPLLRSELALAYDRVGMICRELGQSSDSDRAFRQAVEIQAALVKDQPSVRAYQLNLASMYLNLGGEESFRKALDIELGIARNSPDDLRCQELLARTYQHFSRYARDTSDAVKLIRKGVSVIEKVASDHAENLALQSDLGSAYAGLGYMLLESSRAEAEQLLRKAIDIVERESSDNPSSAKCKRKIAMYYCFLGDLQKNDPGKDRAAEAVASYGKSIENWTALERDNPQVVEYSHWLPIAFGNRSLAHSQLYQFEAALVDINKAIELDPGNGEYQLDRATIYWRLERNNEARADLDSPTAVIISEEGLERRLAFRRGLLLRALGRFREAEAEFQRLVNYYNSALRQPERDTIWLHYWRAIALGELGQNAEALADFAFANDRRLNDRSPQRYPRILIEFGQREQALVESTASCDRVPDNPMVHSVRGIALAELNRYEEAVVEFSRVIQLAPDRAEDWSRRGWIAAAQGHHKQARDDFEQAVRLRGEYHSIALRCLAWFLATCPDVQYRDAARAVTLAEKALREHMNGEISNCGVFHYTIGICRYRAGDYVGARDACQHGIELRGFPYSPFLDARVATEYDHYAGFVLAMSLWQLGEKDKAHAAYVAALDWMHKYCPNDAQNLCFREEAHALMGIK